LKLLVISDPHAQPPLPENDAGRESWWVLGDAPDPKTDPVEAMLHLFKTHRPPLTVDAVLVPGDVCHKAQSAAFRIAWERLRLLAYELGDLPLVATLGNHDVMSRTLGASGPFGFAKTLPNFPVAAELASREYWADGSAIARVNGDWDIVLINTAHHHYSESLARTGTFDSASIDALSRKLAGCLSPPRIAMMHHHPMVHSNPTADSKDVLPTGDAVLNVLANAGVKLVIHGHRHEPRFRRAGTHDMLVFASGSYSIILEELAPSVRNLFHVIELNEDNDGLRGVILSWEFNRGHGWSEASSKSTMLPHIARFSSVRPSVPTVAKAIASLVGTQNPPWLDWANAMKQSTDLASLIPEELEELNQVLMSSHDIVSEKDELGHIRRWTASSRDS
jgi:predicted phosphodiesterase